MTEVLVLCYHAVSDRWPASLSVSPRELEDQLGFLRRRGFRGVTLTEAVTEMSDERRVVVTFDDAYRSVHRIALPILDRLGLPGTVYAPTAFIGMPRPMSWPGIDIWLGTEYQEELLPVTWEELRELASSGWEIGSHTRTHPRLTELGDPALQEELQASKEDCEQHLGVPCRSIAYPYGAVDTRVANAAGIAGYVAGAALPGSFRMPTPLNWPRVGVYRKDSPLRFRLKVSPVTGKARRTMSWSVLQRVRAGSSLLW